MDSITGGSEGALLSPGQHPACMADALRSRASAVCDAAGVGLCHWQGLSLANCGPCNAAEKESAQDESSVCEWQRCRREFRETSSKEAEDKRMTACMYMLIVFLRYISVVLHSANMCRSVLACITYKSGTELRAGCCAMTAYRIILID